MGLFSYFPLPSVAVSPNMKRTVCVLVPLVCGFSLTRIDFPRDSHPSRSCLLGNPLQCRGKSRQGLCLLGDSHFLSQPASFLSRYTFPLLCSHEAKGHFSTSRPTHSLRVATRNKTSCLPSTSKTSDWASLFPIPQSIHPPACPVSHPQDPPPRNAQPPQHQTPPATLPRSCTMHNALQHLNPPRSNNGQPGHVLGTPLFVPCRIMVFGRALPAM